jgi:DNA-directed RNA polymerase subunit RPC12/RpoP
VNEYRALILGMRVDDLATPHVPSLMKNCIKCGTRVWLSAIMDAMHPGADVACMQCGSHELMLQTIRDRGH